MCITTNQPNTKFNPKPNTNSNPDPTSTQHTVVSIQQHIVTCPTYANKFIQDNVIAQFVPLSVVNAATCISQLLLKTITPKGSTAHA